MRWRLGRHAASRFALAALTCIGLGAPAIHAGVRDNPAFNVHGLVVVWGSDGFDTTGNTPVVSDFVIDTGTGTTAASSGDVDIINGDVHTVVTGSLMATQDATNSTNGSPFRVQRVVGGGFTTDFNGNGVTDPGDTFNPFQIRANSDINTRRAELETSFYVASNTAFAIDAQATPLNGTTPFVFNRMRLRLRVTASGTDDGFSFGNAAQFPHSGGTAGGVQNGFRRLSTIETNPRRVFDGNQRTAVAPGSIADQSVRFDVTYRYNSGNIDLSDGVIQAAAEVIYTVYVP
ncbi:MAG: hypothetical protein AAFV54_00360 [Pseudomonadota bacterium]